MQRENIEQPKLIVLYKISDLMQSVKIEEIAKKYSKRIQRASDLVSLRKIVGNGSSALVICDIQTVKEQLPAINRICKDFSCKSLGYYPHVNKEFRQLAIDAGFDFITPRSALVSLLGSTLHPA